MVIRYSNKISEKAVEPNFTRFPHFLQEALQRTMLSGSQFRVALTIIRLTYGFHKEWEKIGLKRIMVLTGLKHDTAAKAVRNLIKFGIVERKGSPGKKVSVLRIQPDIDLWRKYTKPLKPYDQSKIKHTPKDVTNTTKEYENSHTEKYAKSHTLEKKVGKRNIEKSPLEKKEEREKFHTLSSEELKIIHEVVYRWDSMAADVGLEEVKFIEEGPLILEQTLRMTRDKFFMEHFDEVLEKVRNSDFLCGRVTNFRADFEWLLNKDNFIKILNGRYDRKSGGNDLSEGRYNGDPDSELPIY